LRLVCNGLPLDFVGSKHGEVVCCSRAREQIVDRYDDSRLSGRKDLKNS